jgi:hypothetical protein
VGPTTADEGVGPSGLVWCKAVTPVELRQDCVLDKFAIVLDEEIVLSAVKERDRTLLGVVAAWVQQAVWSLWMAVEPARRLLRAHVVGAGGQLARGTPSAAK